MGVDKHTISHKKRRVSTYTLVAECQPQTDLRITQAVAITTVIMLDANDVNYRYTLSN
jgi:hypothetical protein